MDFSTLFKQILEALTRATELAISNNKAIAGLTDQVSALTNQLSESMADDAEDAAKIAAFEEEKAKQESLLVEMTAKLEALKVEIGSVPPITSPSEPIPAPDPVETPVETPAVVTDPAIEIEIPPVITEPEVATISDAPAIGVFEPIIMPGSQNLPSN